ncbi:MAG: 3'(2'),5'-bisphosphate nucleotidase CysQ [Hyphomicrobiaceae bacterium]|nr:3'(2'),5'-bisphosphate nucleotidase CysQ [Hyphomicrobiaceae bacterium]
MSTILPAPLGPRTALALQFARIASQAGAVIMAIYASDFAMRVKADKSPVSEADEQAEAVIVAALRALDPATPILAEEMAAAEGVHDVGPRFFCVDPLDGTRQFASRNGEFTVNIALVENGVPTVGCVYAPVIGRMWIGGETAARADLAPGAAVEAAAFRTIQARHPRGGLTAFVSRSHLDAETIAYVACLDIAERVQIGSSLKFCRIAEGEADIYPRFGPTMEWDTAAAHAVLAAAGGSVVRPDGSPFLYGKAADGYRNGPFVALGARDCLPGG